MAKPSPLLDILLGWIAGGLYFTGMLIWASLDQWGAVTICLVLFGVSYGATVYVSRHVEQPEVDIERLKSLVP